MEPVHGYTIEFRDPGYTPKFGPPLSDYFVIGRGGSVYHGSRRGCEDWISCHVTITGVGIAAEMSGSTLGWEETAGWIVPLGGSIQLSRIVRRPDGMLETFGGEFVARTPEELLALAWPSWRNDRLVRQAVAMQESDPESLDLDDA